VGAAVEELLLGVLAGVELGGEVVVVGVVGVEEEAVWVCVCVSGGCGECVGGGWSDVCVCVWREGEE
jgi:hypothetical protein